MKQILFLDEARTELLEAVEYYQGIYSGLGLDFEQEVKETVRLLAKFPEISPVRADGTQRISTHRFPFQIVFFFAGEVLFVVAVAHHKRFPGYWQDRMDFE